MQAQMHAWEPALLSLAHEAHLSARAAADRFDEVERLRRAESDQSHLERAYAQCAALTAVHSRSFYLASALLPKQKREAARALYAFCRVTDDIVDAGGPNAHLELAAWQSRTAAIYPPHDDLVAVAWADTRRRFEIPLRYAEQLVDGVAQDLLRTRYDTFDELAAYSYGVASTVGLMSMHIIGYSSPDAIRYAIKLGVALQLTNILRDVGEDWRRGRIYLPLADLQQFGLGVDDIRSGAVTDGWRRFMLYQIDRNRQLYDEAIPGLAYLQPDGRFAIAAAAELYRGILDEIEANDYDVFNRRAYVSTARKLMRLPRTWLLSRTVRLPGQAHVLGES